MSKINEYNSESLKEAFPAVYKDFFSTCSTVASAPGNFMWGSNYSAIYGCLSFRQKLPLRTYVGLEEDATNSISLNGMQRFSKRKNQFIVEQMSKELIDKVKKMLFTEIVKLVGEKRFKGLKVKILSEMKPGYGMGASSSLAASLAAALYLHFEKISIDEMRGWAEKKTVDLLRDEQFNKIFRLSWKIDSIFHGLSSGSGSFASLLSGDSPIGYYVLPDEKHKKYQSDFEKGNKSTDDFFDEMNYCGFRLSEIIDLSDNFSLPFSFGIITTSPGQNKYYSAPIVPVEAIAGFESLNDFYKKTFEVYFKKNKNSQEPTFGDRLINNDARGFWHSQIALISTTTLAMMKGIIEMNLKKNSQNSTKDFFANLNKFHCLLRLVGLSTPLLDHLHSFMIRRANALDYENGIGLQQLSADKGGGMVFAIASGKLKEDVPELVEKFNAETGNDVYLSYLSWRDGLEKNGLIIEQSLRNKIYSDYILRGSVQIVHLDRYGLHNDLYTLDEFQKQKKDMDVIFDSVHNEIWIKGEKINYKELRSVVNTIPIMFVLMRNANKSLPKNMLPPSHYLDDRNEFQSKIVSPLVKAIQKRLNCEVNFGVKGKIINFEVLFDPQNVEFHYLKKEF